MSDPLVTIILRSFNEAWALGDTLAALRSQDYSAWELIAFDSGSTDGSIDLLRQAQPKHLIQLKPQDYKPGRVLNQGVSLARTGFCIFLNADATPVDAHWLRPLVEALADPSHAAVYGRQIPRPNCRAVYACDYERCFGPARASHPWHHFFSMVSSGIRKDIWSRRGFLEHLQYAEDDEYTRWCKSHGFKIVFCPDSVVLHSHNYTPQEVYRRSYGDALTLGLCSSNDFNKAHGWLLFLLGWINDLRRDAWFCLRASRWAEFPHAARIRWKQRQGKRDGYRAGAASRTHP